MKRFHVHVGVDDLAAATSFYSTLFGARPSVEKPDYAKWMLDDPRVNFAISMRGAAPGLDHLGIQVDAPEELAAVHARLEHAGEAIADKGETTCCYARSDKGWVVDPAGLSWETFRTFGEATTYGSRKASAQAEPQDSASCCAPVAAAITGGCGAGQKQVEISARAAAACCEPQFG